MNTNKNSAVQKTTKPSNIVRKEKYRLLNREELHHTWQVATAVENSSKASPLAKSLAKQLKKSLWCNYRYKKMVGEMIQRERNAVKEVVAYANVDLEEILG